MEQVVEISSPQKPVNSVVSVLTLLGLLLLLAAISYFIGFSLGKTFAPQTQLKADSKKTMLSAKKNGDSLFSDTYYNYEITFPNTWKATLLDETTREIKLESEEGVLEMWLVFNQQIELSKQQKDGLQKTNQTKLQVNSKTITASEYVFDNGSFLTSGTIASTTNTPEVSFLLKSYNQKTYEVEKGIIKSFTFKK